MRWGCGRPAIPGRACTQVKRPCPQFAGRCPPVAAQSMSHEHHVRKCSQSSTAWRARPRKRTLRQGVAALKHPQTCTQDMPGKPSLRPRCAAGLRCALPRRPQTAAARHGHGLAQRRESSQKAACRPPGPSPRGSLPSRWSALRSTSSRLMATICSAVFHLPSELTCQGGKGRKGRRGCSKALSSRPSHQPAGANFQALRLYACSRAGTAELWTGGRRCRQCRAAPRHAAAPALTALCAPPPEEAAHSRSADIVISREMMRHTGSAMPMLLMGAGGAVASRTRAVDTLQEGGSQRGGSQGGAGGRSCTARRVRRGDGGEPRHVALARSDNGCRECHPRQTRAHDLVGHGVQKGAKGGGDLHLRGRCGGTGAAAGSVAATNLTEARRQPSERQCPCCDPAARANP